MTNTIQTTKLEMINISQDALGKCLIVEGDEHKRIAVERLGIEIRSDETPLAAWLRHLAEINDLPVTTPCTTQISDAIHSSDEALRFMFFIS